MVSLKILQNRVKALLKLPFCAQKSPEWFKQRQTKITASEAASCLFATELVYSGFYKSFPNAKRIKYKPDKGVNSYMTKQEYIIRKCDEYYGTHAFIDTPATLWGKCFEDVAIRLYSLEYNAHVNEFGFVSHPKLNYLGISPDGITDDGVMLEIKCLFKRKINPNEIPVYYWVQAQMQLETCNLDECDFLECEIKELTRQEFIDSESKYKGIIIDNGQNQYVYPPIKEMNTDEFIEWGNLHVPEIPEELPEEGELTDEIKPVTPAFPALRYYDIYKWQVLKINRDKEWFKNVKTDIKNTHAIFTHLQENEKEFLAYKQAFLKEKNKAFTEKYEESVCMIDDSDDDI